MNKYQSQNMEKNKILRNTKLIKSNIEKNRNKNKGARSYFLPKSIFTTESPVMLCLPAPEKQRPRSVM